MVERKPISEGTVAPIRRFVIVNLFGDRDVDIEFESPVKVLIADNGSGKTTILNMVYAVLSRQFYKLRKYKFDKIIVVMSSGVSIEITPEMASVENFGYKKKRQIRRLLHRYQEESLDRLVDELRGMSLSEISRHPKVLSFAEDAGLPIPYACEILYSRYEQAYGSNGSGVPAIQNVRRAIEDCFPYTFLYFPTYRRIEEELKDLGYEREQGVKDEALIRFGMSDVAQRIKEITGVIEKSSVEWYSRISGDMLSQLVDGITVGHELKNQIKEKSALKIVLDRVGDHLTNERKNKIMGLVESGAIYNEKYETLVYFLANLIKMYDEQKQNDTAIKDFTRICSKYLTDKHVVYDESTVDLRVLYKSNGKLVELSMLSSGEKQIVSLFSRLYLESGNKIAVLFDEPELSLSIEWQKMLLPDIVESGRCPFLLATTHSPFIFENNLDGQAYDLAKYVRRIGE